jgi:hypothetical protein
MTSKAERLRVWVVRFGDDDLIEAGGGLEAHFCTEYHAEQYARALALNGTPYTLESPQ